MFNRLRAVMFSLALVLPLAVPTTLASASDTPNGVHSPNMRHVANVAYQLRYGQDLPYGTDIEFATIKARLSDPGRDYAFAGTYRNGLQIIDITNPRAPRIASVYDCAIAQGDVQVFRQRGRTLVAYTADDISRETFTESGCFRDLGIRTKQYGTFLVDVSDPTRPATLGFARVTQGSHNQSVHPSGNFMYNSNADILPDVGNGGPAIEIINIANPRQPRKVGELRLPPGLESHDVTFSRDGRRGYSAALSQSLIIDTSNPAEPKLIGLPIEDPAINIHHQADPITMTDPVLGQRKFLVITDELAGALPTNTCPGGGLHIYDITNERRPVKVGFFDIDEIRPAPDGENTGDRLATCTSHVLRMYPAQKLMTIAWYNAGVRVIDISGLAGVRVGQQGAGLREIGFYRFRGDDPSDTWSAKTNRIEPDGSFYVYANDIERGLDVFRFNARDAQGSETGTGGRWMTPDQALTVAQSRPQVPLAQRLFCLTLT